MKRRSFRGSSTQHGEVASRIVGRLRAAMKRASRDLASSSCSTAFHSLQEAASIRGQYGEERTWAVQRRSGKMRRFHVGGLKSMLALQRKFVSRCLW